MKALLLRSALSTCAATAMLAGCGALPVEAPGAMSQTSELGNSRSGTAWTYKLLERFGSNHPKPHYHGAVSPAAPLLDVNGALYGTTESGGLGYGTVFSISRRGAEKVLYRFGSADGHSPVAGLIDVNGTLYGTTSEGGSGCDSHGCGTVYSISTTGTEKVLYRFSADSDSDGANPLSSLIDVNGTLYGTTSSGGQHGHGTVYDISTSGSEKVLYSFAGATSDGAYPASPLIDLNGTLYGTTYGGGTNGCGIVYGIGTSGVEKVVHDFACRNGGWPDAGLTDVNGMLYGTTTGGGGGSKCACGTVYLVSTTGAFKVIYRFVGGSGGAIPNGGLGKIGNLVYGTTESGGSEGCSCGTVFETTTAGKTAILHSFASDPDGADPVAALVNVSGRLYGTTLGGGASCRDNGQSCGTVFELSP